MEGKTMKHLIVIVLMLVISGMLFAGLDTSLGAGGTVGIFQNTIIDLDPVFGFSVRVGVSDYMSGYFDMLYYEPVIFGFILPPGAELKAQDIIVTAALTLPFTINDMSKLRVGGGLTVMKEKLTGKYLGQSEVLLEVETQGFCILAEIVVDRFIGSFKYIIPSESDNAQSLMLISAIINLS